MTTDLTSFPSYDELSGRSGPDGSSWGLFGNDLGTLNFVTGPALVRAAQEVRRGAVFSLNLATTEPNPPILGRHPLEHHRVPFVMREVDDCSYEEIAEAIGIPVGTVKSRLNRARSSFRSLLPVPV